MTNNSISTQGAKIIAITNPKGGVGKSNTSRTLAAGIRAAGFSVAIVETDPQKSLEEWSSQRTSGTNPPIFSANAGSESQMRKTIEDLQESNPVDFIVIDGCAFDFRMLNTLLNVADLAIIPTQASYDDIIQMGEVIELACAIQLKRQAKKQPPLLARTLINKAKAGAKSVAECQQLLANPDDSGIFCMQTVMRDYEAIRRAAADGKTGFDCGNKNAVSDAKTLTNEVLEIVTQG